VALYNHALTATEVQALASGGSPLTGPQITSFSANKTTAYEGEAVALSWAVNTSKVTGTFSYEIKYGATVIDSGSASTGTFNTTVPDLAGTAQTVSWTLRAIETGGNNVTTSATASLSGNPGIPSATSQAGLTTPAETPLNLTLSGTDPNGGTSCLYDRDAARERDAECGHGRGADVYPVRGDVRDGSIHLQGERRKVRIAASHGPAHHSHPTLGPNFDRGARHNDPPGERGWRFSVEYLQYGTQISAKLTPSPW
jgi:hypothetical protein